MMKIVDKIKYSGLLLAVLCPYLAFANNDLPNAQEEARTLESIFLKSSHKNTSMPLLGITNNNAVLTKRNTEHKEHKKEMHISSMGKGKALSDEEINRSLLTFVKEKELKIKEMEEKAKQKKAQEESSVLHNFPRTTSPNVQTISVEEQKARILAGLPQFPDQEIDDGIYEEENKTNPPSIEKFYGVSCIDKNCVLIGNNKIYSVGDTMNGGEKIISITKEKVVTSNGEFFLKDNGFI